MKPVITVVGLGPGDPALLTLQAADTLRGKGTLILRTGRHGVSAWLDDQGISYLTLDQMYDKYEDFDALHNAMAQHLWQQAARSSVIYGVMDPSSDRSVKALQSLAPATGTLNIQPCITAAVDCMASGRIHTEHGIRIVQAMDVAHVTPDPHLPLMIT